MAGQHHGCRGQLAEQGEDGIEISSEYGKWHLARTPFERVDGLNAGRLVKYCG
jgi:hypothetical protein